MEAPQQHGRSSQGTGGDRAGLSSSWEDQAMEALRAQRVDKPQVLTHGSDQDAVATGNQEEESERVDTTKAQHAGCLAVGDQSLAANGSQPRAVPMDIKKQWDDDDLFDNANPIVAVLFGAFWPLSVVILPLLLIPAYSIVSVITWVRSSVSASVRILWRREEPFAPLASVPLGELCCCGLIVVLLVFLAY